MDPSVAISRFAAFGAVGPQEIEVLVGLARPAVSFRRGQKMRGQGDPDPTLYLLHEGWAATSIMTRQGDRQFLRVHTPGDLMGMSSVVLASAHDSITALSAVMASEITSASIKTIFTKSPRLAAMLFAISQQERIVLMDRILSLGRLDAQGRIASLILELQTQLSRGGQSPPGSFKSPLTQQDMSDFVGITSVHINRSLAALRDEGVATWKNGVITITDERRLRALADFLPSKFTYEPTWLPDQ